jgi:hypothetical protein
MDRIEVHGGDRMRHNTPTTVKAAGAEGFTSGQREPSTSLSNSLQQQHQTRPGFRWRVDRFLTVELLHLPRNREVHT